MCDKGRPVLCQSLVLCPGWLNMNGHRVASLGGPQMTSPESPLLPSGPRCPLPGELEPFYLPASGCFQTARVVGQEAGMAHAQDMARS